jgi:hypothetical protein
MRVGHTDAVSSPQRARRPFWLHQAAEYVVGVALIAQGLQAAEPLVPGAAGALIVVNAAVAKGPLSAFSVVGRRLHRILDVVLIAVLVAAAVTPWVETAMRFVLVAFAVVLGFVARYTRYETRAEASATRRLHAREAGGTAGDRAEDLGRQAGRLAGRGVKAWRARR